MSSKKHIAGIIPVSGIVTDFNMPWHDSLMPIAPNYLAVERAVAECAYAGCDSIWIVCNDSVSPLIRYQVGEKVQDPVYAYRHFEFDKGAVKKPIRIYYVPLAIKDINKRDNLAWSAIFGAQSANKVLGSLSRQLKPHRFYICWPYGYSDPRSMREHRKTIIEKDVALLHIDKTVKENKYLSFTITEPQIKKLVEESITTSSGLWNEGRKKRLSLDERYSYKSYDLKKVFSGLDFSNYEKIEVEDYFALDCWTSYRDFLAKDLKITKPKILKYSEWNEIGVNDD
jgi:hypothetical protein